MLDESFHVPIADQPSDDSSDESSSDDARHKYDKWLKEQPKDIKMMAVMFTGTMISRFNMTTCGAVNEVSLVVNNNEKTVNGGGTCTTTFTESKQGKHAVVSFQTMKVCVKSSRVG